MAYGNVTYIGGPLDMTRQNVDLQPYCYVGIQQEFSVEPMTDCAETQLNRGTYVLVELPNLDGGGMINIYLYRGRVP
jgi:hypothetical protein